MAFRPLPALKAVVRGLPIPEGWTEHDGSGLPVHPYSRAAVLLRDGTGWGVGIIDAHAFEWVRGDQWTWSAEEAGSEDIVAYQPEPDEFVSVPRLQLGSQR